MLYIKYRSIPNINISSVMSSANWYYIVAALETDCDLDPEFPVVYIL